MKIIIIRLLTAAASVLTGFWSFSIACAIDSPILVLDTGGHTAAVHSLAFTADGNQLISVSKDKTIRVWDIVQGVPLRTFRLPVGEGAHGELYAAAISPDGRRLAVGGFDLSICVIDLSQGQIERQLEGHQSSVLGLTFSSDGTKLASASADGTARVWNMTDGSVAQTLRGHHGPIRSLCFSHTGDRIATASDDATGRIWSLEGDGLTIAVLKGHRKLISRIDWSPNGELLATGSDDGTLRLWNSTGEELNQYVHLGKIVNTVVFTPNSKEILFTWRNDSGKDAGAGFLDIESGEVRIRFEKSFNYLMCGAISRDGQLSATAGFNPEDVRVWRSSNAEQLFQLQGRGDTKWSVAWSPDGNAIAWGNEPYRDRVPQFNDKGTLQKAFDVTKLDFVQPDDSYQKGGRAPDNLTIEAIGESSVTVKQDDQRVATLDVKSYGRLLRSAAVLDNRNALLGFNLEPVALVNFRTGSLIRRFVGHSGAVWGISVSPDRRYFVTASHDQTVKVWAVTSGRPLLSFHFAEPEWIVWTPDGYYAASPGGEKLVGWQVNDESNKFASFHPVERFRDEFYRPDLIRNLLATGSVERSLDKAAEETGQRAQKTEINKVLPPKVIITSPAKSGTRLTVGKFDVRAVVATEIGQPITTLALLVDGRPYRIGGSFRKLSQPQSGTVNEVWGVDLTPGPHRLAVVASSAFSQAVSDEVEIHVSSTADSTAATASLHLLAVGINDYPGKMKLDCAVPDAKAIEEAFRTQSRGLYKVQSTLLLDQKATRQAILQALDNLAKKARPGDVAVAFYAGHGDCKLAGQFYLLPSDVNVRKLAETGVSGEEVRHRLGKLPCTALLVMDCCYAGSFDAGKKKRALPTAAGDLVRELVSDDQGLVVMCGASKEQESGEEAKLGHGYFTQAMVEGLSGKAASRRDGLVYLSGLQLYVEERVRELSNDEQYPTIGKPTLIRSFPLSKP